MKLGFARRVTNRYGSDITGLVGGSVKDAQFQWDRSLGSDTPAVTYGNVVKLNPSWFQQAGRADARGAIIHELTHVARGQHPAGTGAWAGQPEEQIADAVRFSLNGRVGINPDSFPAARKLAVSHGWFDPHGGNGMAGPGSNLTGTRSNNTLIHNASKQIPALGPLASTGLNAQLQGLQTQFSAAKALQASQIAAARSTAILGRQTANANEVAGMAGAVNGALDRGIIGSSVDTSARAGVVTQQAAELAGVANTRAQSIAAARANTLQALGQYYTGIGQVSSQAAAQQAELQIQAYANDTLNTNLSDFQRLMARYMRGQKKHHGPNNPNSPGHSPGLPFPVTPQGPNLHYNRSGAVQPGPIQPGTY